MAIKGKPSIEEFLGGADRDQRVVSQPVSTATSAEPQSTCRQKMYRLPIEICDQLREQAYRRSLGGARVSETELVVEALRAFLSANKF